MSDESYTAVIGLRYPDGPMEVQKRKNGKADVKWKSVEAGTKGLTDIPKESVKWLLAEGSIVPDKAAPAKQKGGDD